MRILIVGATGMLGHKMVQALCPKFPDTWWTVSGSRDEGTMSRVPFLRSDRCLAQVDLTNFVELRRILEGLRPDVIINCAGVIKQRPEAARAIPSIAVNALLPHQLALLAGGWGGRLIHFSTDCVFSGRTGSYTEDDAPDAADLYGRSKALGEVVDGNVVTFRTSFIGRELQHHRSLLDWFLLSGLRRVSGYRRVWWSGVTTNHLADLVSHVLERHPNLAGLYHVSSGRISKYDLLCRLNDVYGLGIEIEPVDQPVNDRTLDGSKLSAAIGYRCPPWDELVAQLVNDHTPYDVYRVRAKG